MIAPYVCRDKAACHQQTARPASCCTTELLGQCFLFVLVHREKPNVGVIALKGNETRWLEWSLFRLDVCTLFTRSSADAEFNQHKLWNSPKTLVFALFPTKMSMSTENGYSTNIPVCMQLHTPQPPLSFPLEKVGIMIFAHIQKLIQVFHDV